MSIHFTEQELLGRQRAVLDAMQKEGLDGLLMFRQESMYYLTGYDTFGFVFFQCLFLGADGQMVLLTRAPDVRQAKYTSTIRDIRVWQDGDSSNPALDLKAVLQDYDCAGKTLGIEWEAYGLTARNGQRVANALEGFCRLKDASWLVSRLRVIKSAAELAYVRRAGELADMALAEAQRLAVPGAWEGDILAAMQGIVFRNDGDPPANEQIIGSGGGAFLGRYYSGRRHIEANDELSIEFAGVFRHYHAAVMRTFRIGTPNSRQVRNHGVALEALDACKRAFKVGEPLGNVFGAFRKVVDAAGFGSSRTFSCGYSLGTTFAPNWMDWPMLYEDNKTLAQPNMVFFLHMTLRDDEHRCNVTPGETIVVTETGYERLSKASLELVNN